MAAVREGEVMSADLHLWDVNHPYYAAQGNYYARPDAGLHAEYSSWVEFMESEGDSDLDMNLVYRWDWQVPDPDDYKYELEEDADVILPPETLDLFYVGQRKALLRSVSVEVQREDEPAIREWLTVRAEHMRKVWEPLL